MENMLKTIAKKSSTNTFTKDDILEDIKTLKTRITGVSVCLNMESNEELIEAYIYELKGLNIRLNYLLKTAKDIM